MQREVKVAQLPLVGEVALAVKRFAGDRMRTDAVSIDDIPPGGAGIVLVDGEYVAVSKAAGSLDDEFPLEAVKHVMLLPELVEADAFRARMVPARVKLDRCCGMVGIVGQHPGSGLHCVRRHINPIDQQAHSLTDPHFAVEYLDLWRGAGLRPRIRMNTTDPVGQINCRVLGSRPVRCVLLDASTHQTRGEYQHHNGGSANG